MDEANHEATLAMRSLSGPESQRFQRLLEDELPNKVQEWRFLGDFPLESMKQTVAEFIDDLTQKVMEDIAS